MTVILDSISSPADLRRLTLPELEQLAGEIRTRIIEVVCRSGGHLASNLGVVELTLALHRVFDFRTDRLLWDVGHQCYVHKLLTGRNARYGRPSRMIRLLTGSNKWRVGEGSPTTPSASPCRTRCPTATAMESR